MSDVRLLGVPESATYLGIGRSTLYELFEAGEIHSVSIGGRRLVPIEELDRYVESLKTKAS